MDFDFFRQPRDYIGRATVCCSYISVARIYVVGMQRQTVASLGTREGFLDQHYSKFCGNSINIERNMTINRMHSTVSTIKFRGQKKELLHTTILRR